jgi:hypothetical protein
MAIEETTERFQPDEALPIVTWNISCDEACANTSTEHYNAHVLS